MRGLEDKVIDAMTADELREELRSLRSRYRDMHRRAQHSITGLEQSKLASERDAAKAETARWRKSWVSEFDRVLSNHKVVKEIYELAAKKLGLPYGIYHSVSDLPFARKSDGGLYANVMRDPRKGGIETFDVKEVVEQAINSEAA